MSDFRTQQINDLAEMIDPRAFHYVLPRARPATAAKYEERRQAAIAQATVTVDSLHQWGEEKAASHGSLTNYLKGKR